jgi:hypothetical protein
LTSLAVLTVASGLIGYFAMRHQPYRGADFVVLIMAVAILFAFSVAVLNWITGKITGFRFLSLLAQQVTFVMVPRCFSSFSSLAPFSSVWRPRPRVAPWAPAAPSCSPCSSAGSTAIPIASTWLKSAVESTAILSAFVVFILIGARIFSLTFYGVNGHVWVERLLTSLPGGQVGFLVFVNVLVFLLAFFLDFFEIAFIIIPLIGPAAEKIGIDLIWLGVKLGVNMQTSFMHPPFGFALFYLRSVAPREPYKDRGTGSMTAPVTTGQIYWGAVPFVVIQCIMVGLVIAFPGMVMHYKATGPAIDPSKIEIQLPPFAVPAGGPPGLSPPTAAGGTPPAVDLGKPAELQPPSATDAAKQ